MPGGACLTAGPCLVDTREYEVARLETGDPLGPCWYPAKLMDREGERGVEDVVARDSREAGRRGRFYVMDAGVLADLARPGGARGLVHMTGNFCNKR